MDKQSFDMMKHGYNRYQVDDYVQQCALEKDEIEKKLLVNEKMVQDLEQQLANKHKDYETLLSNLDVKEKAANEMTMIAMKEANMIVETAKKNADAILKESLIMARGILLDIAKLGNDANTLKGNMKDELYQLLQALDEFETPQIPDMDLLKKKM